jgi:hypothetical protein
VDAQIRIASMGQHRRAYPRLAVIERLIDACHVSSGVLASGVPVENTLSLIFTGILAMSYRRERLTTINRPHGPGLVLARRYPGDEHRRALAIEHWQHASYSPRQHVEPGIDIPVSPREQSALQATLPRDLCDALNGAAPPTAQSRRASETPQPPISVPSVQPLGATPEARRRHGIARIRARLG